MEILKGMMVYIESEVKGQILWQVKSVRKDDRWKITQLYIFSNSSTVGSSDSIVGTSNSSNPQEF